MNDADTFDVYATSGPLAGLLLVFRMNGGTFELVGGQTYYVHERDRLIPEDA